MDKVVKEIVKALGEQGFDVIETKNSRLRVYLGPEYVTTLPTRFRAGTGLANGLAPLRRAGFIWPAS
jgi:hypothetical protein